MNYTSVRNTKRDAIITLVLVCAIIIALVYALVVIINIHLAYGQTITQDREPFMPKTVNNMLNDGIFVGIVSRIVDGDTFELSTGEKIRLALVNTPERGEKGYNEARQWLSNACLNRMAIIDLDNGQSVGSYGRYIGWVDRCGSVVDINLKLFDMGLAESMDNGKYCEVSEFKNYSSSICPLS